MNCDEVFQQLTSSEPESSNGQLERHLASCSSCRQMADLFLPAVELFHGSKGEDPVEAAEAWQRVWEAVAVAERTAGQLNDLSRVGRSARWRSWSLACQAALLLVGVFIGGVMARAGVFGHPVASHQLGSSAASAPSTPLDRPPTGRCELLVASLGRAADAAICPTCGRPADFRSNPMSLCIICHLMPPAALSDPQQLESSLRPSQRQPRPPALDEQPVYLEELPYTPPRSVSTSQARCSTLNPCDWLAFAAPRPTGKRINR